MPQICRVKVIHSFSSILGEILAFLARRRRNFGVSGSPQANFDVSGPLQANFWCFWPAAGEILPFLARRRRTFGVSGRRGRNDGVSGPPQANFWRFWPAAGEILAFLARRRRNVGVSGPPQANFFVFESFLRSRGYVTRYFLRFLLSLSPCENFVLIIHFFLPDPPPPKYHTNFSTTPKYHGG